MRALSQFRQNRGPVSPREIRNAWARRQSSSRRGKYRGAIGEVTRERVSSQPVPQEKSQSHQKAPDEPAAGTGTCLTEMQGTLTFFVTCRFIRQSGSSGAKGK